MTGLRTLTIAAAMAAPLLLAGYSAQAQNRVEAGMLTCQVAGGAGFIFGSSKALTCTFEGQGFREVYTGSIDKFGVDLGFTAASVIAWGVLSPTSNMGPGALAGTYSGVSGEATVGAGLGANVLLGGSNQSIALQPVSVQAQSGLNVAAGVTSITLQLAQ
ncbi:hypothetical protein FHS85_002746 [Rhodoligotrophos appendicifer]|uniref:DUF992 domain-containing protein n=1 Tax=Rhodoligotrophos appendicifer TaxID=987056 RepID=UPI0011862682|nr:DUF992 domain-containing protein [Rhodoligotrophos appendicifer]